MNAERSGLSQTRFRPADLFALESPHWPVGNSWAVPYEFLSPEPRAGRETLSSGLPRRLSPIHRGRDPAA